MHKLPVIIFLLFLSFILIPINISAKNTVIPDSLLTKDQAYKYTFSDPEKAAQIIALMRERKTEPEHLLDIIEGDLYYNNGKINDALVFYTRALNSEAVRNDDMEYMEQLHRMISCYDSSNDWEKKSEYTQLLLDKATETGNKEMKSVALFNMGKTIYYQEDKERGYQLIYEAIEEMKQSDYKHKYDNLRYNYNSLLIMQIRDGKYEDALVTLDALESVVTAKTPESTYMEGLDEKEIKTLLAYRTVALSFLERMEEAEEFYKQWEATARDYTREDYLIVPFLLHSRRFDKVIEIYDPRERFLYENKDTVSYYMRTVKRSLAKAYEGKEDYLTAARYYKELAKVTDSLNAREQRSAALELATVYETHEKEAKLQEQATHIKARNMLLASAGIAIFFLILLLIHNIKHTRTIRNKNKLMALTIEDLLVHKDELFEAKEELHALKGHNEIITGNAGETANTGGKELETDMNVVSEDKLLFETLNNIVIREKLYLDPGLSREQLMKRIGVNKNRFGQILQENTGGNTTAYINNKRLEYAARLMQQHPGYTIAALAEMSGIPNVPTFNRLFKSKFGMTPREFRESMQNSDNKSDTNK